ncbi:DNA adenine methylase [Corynebacterium accolens]|jgi:D12 class N6 adenine-specific DNA methyltransferase|uniref:DNA adenine methylase n=1 Tax=Corynebacterium accolens TaxID=38284 RepID=UPI00204C5017|nr:DNA adenine methylase [Corynebacterium accolens]MDK8505548.1 DNA adenine methylase [Corynebacterium accolens]MDK8662398.1 DNA adenine methylase [Corynebacterium accolens]DAI33632.1 MAG TPA: DNA adenine methylase [Caudoviricetes sp.]
MRIKPPFPYLGSKARLAPKIVNLLPDHTHYVEPYAGSLSVLLAKPRSVAETINDSDRNLINLWRIIRDHPQELADKLALTPHSPIEYYGALRDLPDTDDPIEQARRTLTILTQGVSRTTEHGGMWARYINYQPKGINLPRQLDRFTDRILPAAQRLHGVSIDSRPALEAITMYGRSKNVLLYLDPPYLPSTRSGSSYPYDMTTEDHEELLATITSIKAKVVISGYASRLYDEALDGWERHEFAAQARGMGPTSSPRTEIVWVKPC